MVELIGRLLMFTGIIGGLIYGLIKENEVVIGILAIFGLLFIGKIIWDVIVEGKDGN